MSATPPARHWPFPPRFLLLLAVMPLAGLGLAPWCARWGQAVLAGFDAAALVYIGSLWPLSRDRTPARIRAHAAANDARRPAVLVITGLLMLVIVTAVAVELPDARADTSRAHVWGLLLVLASLVIAWVFSNCVYALHYAHLYYRGAGEGGLNFPEQRESPQTRPYHPDFGDFLYFAITVGMAFATSDVEVTRPDIRRTVTLHGALAFFYNLIVLAFTINVTASG